MKRFITILGFFSLSLMINQSYLVSGFDVTDVLNLTFLNFETLENYGLEKYNFPLITVFILYISLVFSMSLASIREHISFQTMILHRKSLWRTLMSIYTFNFTKIIICIAMSIIAFITTYWVYAISFKSAILNASLYIQSSSYFLKLGIILYSITVFYEFLSMLDKNNYGLTAVYSITIIMIVIDLMGGTHLISFGGLMVDLSYSVLFSLVFGISATLYYLILKRSSDVL